MDLHIIDAGTFKCDGGGIFGGVPKLLWSRQVKADERNLITLAMRCMLLEIDDRKILIETGAGDKLSWKFIDNNGIENSHLLIDSIEKAGFKAEDISDVIHTHLHWDHCGGGTTFDENKKAVPTFPNANYYCSKAQWENAMTPNPREGDAYFENDLLPVKDSVQLKLIDKEIELYPGLSLRIFNGHTPGQIVPIIEYKGKTIVYIADLVPTVANIPLKWIAAYDLYPVTAMEEKEKFLREAFKNNYILFFEHDMDYECATLDWDERKGPKVKEKGMLFDFL